MTKYIICLDGTANSEYIENNPLTNVSRLRRSIAHFSDDGRTRQVVHYQGGVGTGFGNPFNYWQQAIGKEIKRIIIQAYTFLCDNYEGASHDQVVLIGFSRGAFAARCLADLIHQHGVLPKGELNIVHRLYEYWINPGNRGQHEPPEEFRGSNTPIIACALWDTVGAVGVPMHGNIYNREFSFIHSDIPGSVQHIFQALALHERRYHFFPIILHRPSLAANPQLEQCWFAGHHADTGGGNTNDALAHFALVWIISKLKTWINFNTEDVSIPLIPQTTWRIGDSLGICSRKDGSYRLPVQDPMNPFFRAGGIKYRIPQTEFWNVEGFHQREVNPNENDPNDSCEEMHSTTRFLIQTKLVDKFYAAQGLLPSRPEEDQPWTWNLRCGTRPLEPMARRQAYSWLSWFRKGFGLQVEDNQESNNINEVRLDDFERETLNDWATVDHHQFDDIYHLPGEKPPNTVLVHLRAWLDDYESEAIPIHDL